MLNRAVLCRLCRHLIAMEYSETLGHADAGGVICVHPNLKPKIPSNPKP